MADIFCKFNQSVLFIPFIPWQCYGKYHSYFETLHYVNLNNFEITNNDNFT